MVSLPRTAAVVAVATVGLGLAIAAPAQASPSAQPPNAAPKQVVSAYFADWDVYGRQYFVKDIPADKLNVIQYAFGVPGYDAATGTPSCGILDPWADYQQPYWTGDNSVDGVADDPSNPDQHLFGNFNQLMKLKAAHPGLKVEISLGGWTKSTWFSTLASTPDLRQKFVASCIDTFIKGDLPAGGWPAGAGGAGAAAGLFDGIDLDWEYPTQVAGGNVGPTAADRHNATLLAQEFRAQLDAYGKTTGKHYLLTAALPAATSSTKYYELGAFVKQLDWANVMTYDFNVPSSPVTALDTLFLRDPRDPNAANRTWNTVGTVQYYLDNGIPPKKIVVGVPFYGNQYIRTGSSDDGLYTPFDNTGLDPNALTATAAPQPTYHELVDQAGFVSADGKTGASGYTVHWDTLAGEPFLFNPAASHPDLTTGPATVPTLISFTSPASAAERVALIKALGLRGAMAWEISQDSDSHALMNVIGRVLQ
jgi:chitinase